MLHLEVRGARPIVSLICVSGHVGLVSVKPYRIMMPTRFVNLICSTRLA